MTDSLLAEARATVDSIGRTHEPTLPILRSRAMVYERLSWRADTEGHYDEAAADVAQLAEATRRMVALSPDGPARSQTVQSEILVLQHQSYLKDKAARFDEAIEIQARAVRLADSLAAGPGTTQRTRGIHAETLAQLGWRYNDADRPDEAEEAFTASLAITRGIQREDPTNLSAVTSQATYLDGRGQARLRAERWTDALVDHQEAIDLLEPLEATLPVASLMLVQLYRELGEAHTRLGKYEEAGRNYVASLHLAEAQLRADTTNAFARKVLALSYLSHALHYRLRVQASGDASLCAPAAAEEARGQEAWDWLRARHQAFPGEETIWADFESMMPANVCVTE